MLAPTLSLVILVISAIGAVNSSQGASDVISRVGGAQHHESQLLVARGRKPKRAALDRFGASLTAAGRSGFTQCGQADIVFEGSGNARPLSLVLIDPGKALASFKARLSTFKEAQALAPYAIFSVSARDGQSFRFTIPVPSRYGFDAYAYFNNGTGKYLGVGSRRVGAAASNTAKCIVSCRKDYYSFANTCQKCASSFGSKTLTCDASGAKTCSDEFAVKQGKCVSATATRSAGNTTAKTTARKTTASAVPTGSGGSSTSVKTLSLNEHNKFRAAHGANPLVWDDTLAKFAQDYANKCVFKHSGGPYGENLAAMAGDANANVVSGIKLWEDEESQFTCAKPVYSHYTQMVWRSTTKIGCAEAKCPPGSIFSSSINNQKYWVCEYSDTVGNFGDAANYCKNVNGK
ncbi:BQ2448_1688 [Microbotryum intermedium]|uniref:BQ2448_1688 protein n=1 Tax=Microbotryum intermedium TaxID=269621 RepID=A0A238FEJ1_9BASI|nr:BQ2448_1688 [Microbotryum intermedium]